MYHNKQSFSEPEYETNSYNMESEYEFEDPYRRSSDHESENEFEMIPGFEINDEGGFELSNEEEMEFENESENENEDESYKDEMEAELEYVTNESEFENWVNEVAVRNRRGGNLRPVLRTRMGRNAVNHFRKVATGTLPYLGRKRGGWNGGGSRRQNQNRPGSFGHHRHHRGNNWRNNFGSQQPSQDQGYPTPDPMYPSPGMPMPQQGAQDGSFKNFVLDTLKNLSGQITSGTESMAALRDSIVNSAKTNLPSIVQPADGAAPPAADAPPPPAAGSPGEMEFEMEDHEYNMEEEGEVTNNESSFSEETEMELASELLSVKTDAELDHFLGGLLSKAVGAVSGLLGGGKGNILKGVLKNVVKKALPLAGAAAGTFFGGPIGTAIGEKVGQTASGLFELELEGLSNEDREFEVARAAVRFAGNAAKQVADQRGDDPQQNVRKGITEAATRFAPGLLLNKHHRHHRHHHHGYGNFADQYTGNNNNGESGTWYKKGNRIIIENAG
ncbi:MAG TPA: hypothetical protein VK644_05140 [Chitinophagaceae bacterium]|nr:hypothetical protein [Chitinophagaceae bacterium]